MKIKPRKKIKLEGRRAVRQQLIKSYGRKVARELVEALDPAAQAEVANAAASGGDAAGGGGNVDALLALVRQVLENPNITAEDSIKMVSKRLKALKEMIPGGSNKDAGAADPAAGMEGEGDDDEEDDDEADTDTAESEDDDEEDADPPAKGKKKVKPEGKGDAVEDRLARLEAREERVAVRELCEGAGFRPTDKQMKLLLACEDEDTREDLIESWTDAESNPAKIRKTIRGGRAKATDVLEGGGGKPGRYKTSKDWAAGLVG